MKRSWLSLFIVPVMLNSCQTEIDPGQPCSINFAGVAFTKAFNNAPSLVTVEGKKLIFKSTAKTDNFNEPDGKMVYFNAPVLLSRIDNTKPFTFVTKVTPAFQSTYDAGALYVYMNRNWWFKFAFERDERARTRVVTVRTIDTSDDNNHDVVASESIYMKISSDTKTIGFYYSVDNVTWELVRLYQNNYPAETWIGLSSQSPMGNGIIATFEDCSLTESSVKDFRMGI